MLAEHCGEKEFKINEVLSQLKSISIDPAYS